MVMSKCVQEVLQEMYDEGHFTSAMKVLKVVESTIPKKSFLEWRKKLSEKILAAVDVKVDIIS
jgi:hypothetical protein